MGIAVLIKQVPDTTSKVDVSGGLVDESSVSKWSISPYDEYALECAMQLKESGYSEVVAITCGPERSSKALTEAAAVGADSLIHVQVEDILDSIQVQSLLSAAIKRTDSEIVFCGKQAADTNSGSTGPGIASILDYSCVGVVSEVTVDDGVLVATRQGPSSLEEIEVTSPCLFTFDKGDSELRRPNVRGIMMAKKKTVEALTPGDLGVDLGESPVIVNSHSSPPDKPPGQKFEGVSSVATVVQMLRDEANVI